MIIAVAIPRRFTDRFIDKVYHRFPFADASVLRHLHIPDDAFDKHDADVHHHADSDGDTRKGNYIGGYSCVAHDDEGRQHGDREHAGYHGGCPEVEDQHDDNDDTDQYFVG